LGDAGRRGPEDELADGQGVAFLDRDAEFPQRVAPGAGVRETLKLNWGTEAVSTWNARRASVLSWLGWCEECGYGEPSVQGRPSGLGEAAVGSGSETPARSKVAVDRLIARREVNLREKTLWRMLYETAARAEEILGVNIEDLDFAGRRCPVKAKGARSKDRRREPSARGLRAGGRLLGRRHRPAQAPPAARPDPRLGVRHPSPYAGRAPAGTCTSTAIPPRPTSAGREPGC
jgi:integrase